LDESKITVPILSLL